MSGSPWGWLSIALSALPFLAGGLPAQQPPGVGGGAGIEGARQGEVLAEEGTPALATSGRSRCSRCEADT